jgi:hypothetical protein
VNYRSQQRTCRQGLLSCPPSCVQIHSPLLVAARREATYIRMISPVCFKGSATTIWPDIPIYSSGSSRVSSLAKTYGGVQYRRTVPPCILVHLVGMWYHIYSDIERSAWIECVWYGGSLIVRSVVYLVTCRACSISRSINTSNHR